MTSAGGPSALRLTASTRTTVTARHFSASQTLTASAEPNIGGAMMWTRSDGKYLRVRIGYIVHSGVEFNFSTQSSRSIRRRRTYP